MKIMLHFLHFQLNHGDDLFILCWDAHNCISVFLYLTVDQKSMVYLSTQTSIQLFLHAILKITGPALDTTNTNQTTYMEHMKQQAQKLINTSTHLLSPPGHTLKLVDRLRMFARITGKVAFIWSSVARPLCTAKRIFLNIKV